MSEDVTFKARGGAEAHGALGRPATDGAVGAVVLLHEWWGLNEQTRGMCDRIAGMDFLVLAPDLYQGKVAANAEEAAALMNALSWTDALEVIAGALAHLQDDSRCNGNVAVLGFCMGGAGAFVAAGNIPGFVAAVPFYGLPPDRYMQWDTFNVPVQAHFARRDDWAKADVAKALQARLQAQGCPMDLYVYDAQHAFVNERRLDVHDPSAAKLALARVNEFLHDHLG
ncbi:MAG: dienelactone hydrolase family protein [Deltaproteobacteria bacterium]|nr:dienelactone hydrolase family protein [Deltaproteobacteria bacterium]